MPEDGSKLVDVAALADAAAQVELSVPLALLERLAPLLASSVGTASGRIGFSRERGHVVADVQADAAFALRCQRCLEEFVLPVTSRSRVALVADESPGGTLPEELETALAAEGRMRLRDLLEEELLLAVPASPRHEEAECEVKAEVADSDVAESAGIQEAEGRGTTRPFAGLADLIGSQGLKK
jgi:uncharacterized protein